MAYKAPATSICIALIALVAGILCPLPLFADAAALPPELPLAADGKSTEIQFIFNTLLFLFSGITALMVVVGFTLLEAGSVKQQHLSAALMKNLLGYALCGIAFYAVGYHLLFTGVEGGWHGTFMPWKPEDASTVASENFVFRYAASSEWFFQMVLASFTVLIVSGVLAVRVRLEAYLIFCALLAGVIYPVANSWVWGGGWLAALNYFDFAGASVIHTLAGWCALTATLIIGPRKGRFEAANKPRPHRNLGFLALGTMLLWIGFLGYTGGSQLVFGSAADAADVSNIIVNTNLAACGGLLTAWLLHHVFYRHKNSALVLSGAIGGLVSIAAEPLVPPPYMALLIGAVGGGVVILFSELLRVLRIDDVTGGLPVHLGCGIWGTLAVSFTNPAATFLDQLIGLVAISLFAAFVSAIIWMVLAFTLGIRITDEAQLARYS